MRKLVLIVIALAIVALAAGLIVFPRDGFSARGTPSALETFTAQTARRLSVPKGAKEMKNPAPDTADVLKSARLHFADHCATCHANNGSGDTEIGRNLYPKAPDLRLQDTQKLTDGELYYIIENGIRLTGMPAWGKGGNDDEQSWALVRFIRHLPKLTKEEEREMRAANPKTEQERREEQEEQEFLNEPTTNDTGRKH